MTFSNSIVSHRKTYSKWHWNRWALEDIKGVSREEAIFRRNFIIHEKSTWGPVKVTSSGTSWVALEILFQLPFWPNFFHHLAWYNSHPSVLESYPFSEWTADTTPEPFVRYNKYCTKNHIVLLNISTAHNQQHTKIVVAWCLCQQWC